MKPHLIGIAGPSGSGKSCIANQLLEILPRAAVVSLDSYYRNLDGMPFEQRTRVNYDLPEALEWELLREHLEAASSGRPFDEPVYDFARHVRAPETKRIQPREFLIVEGILALHWPELRAMLDTKVYVQTAPEVCYARRLARDVAERGRTPESVREQYETTVRPSAERYVFPTAKYADLVVSGEEPLAQSTAAVIGAIRRAYSIGA